MKCISCEIEINPQWAHAIEQNICPFCGKHILEEHLKNLFSSLRDTMAALQKYPQQLDDWMFSNHAYIKTDSPDLVKHVPEEVLREYAKVENDKDFQKRKENQKFTVKVKTETGEEEVVAERIQSEERTNEFFKRAEVIRDPSGKPQAQISAEAAAGKHNFQSITEKTQHNKALVAQIKKEGAKGVTASGNSMMLPAEMLENADPEAVAEFQSMISGGEAMPSSMDSDIDDDIPGGDYILQANMAAAAAKSGNSSDGGYNAKDAHKLQSLQSRVANSRKAMINGTGGKGSFSRS